MGDFFTNRQSAGIVRCASPVRIVVSFGYKDSDGEEDEDGVGDKNLKRDGDGERRRRR